MVGVATATMLWTLPLLLGLGGVGVPEIVGTAATTLVCPATIAPVVEGEAPV